MYRNFFFFLFLFFIDFMIWLLRKTQNNRMEMDNTFKNSSILRRTNYFQ